ncbi:MAG: CBS domain-containing protein [Mycobacterium sp.]|nr:CBS domain-containing protein [Mycobacterium sp.]
MRIADILRDKGSAVATVTETTTVTALLADLAAHNIGSMVVIGTGGQERSDSGNVGGGQERSDSGNVGSSTAIVGIVSERDVVRKLHEYGPGLLGRPVADVMSPVVVTCSPEDRVDDLAALMTDNRVRHVPVLVDGQLVGIVSIGDVVKNRMAEMSAQHQQLQAYITQGAS